MNANWPKIDWLVKTLLFTIAVLLSVIAFRPAVAPPAVHAQGPEGYPFYVEPGVTMLRAPDGSRQVYGKVVVDLSNGKVWGFPTMTPDSPYPINQMNSTPPTSHPFLLAKYAFGDTAQ
ncbi:MAG TPA: hypothetical protein VLL05_03660 [Terriglobales bacterium]|nr:hypothetical protein [Terriglobales bacterium]